MSPFDVAWTLLKEDDIYEQLPNSAWYSDFGEEWLQSQDPSYREFLQREEATEKRLKDMEEGNAPRPFAEFEYDELASIGFNKPFLQTPEQKQALTDEMRLRTPDAEQQMLSQQPFNMDFQEKLASEPFDLAWTLLKDSLVLEPPLTQGVEEQVPMQEDTPTVDVNTMAGGGGDCCEDVRAWLLSNVKPNSETYKALMNASCEEIKSGRVGTMVFAYDSVAKLVGCSEGFNSGFQDKFASEPFDLAWTMVHQNRR